MTRYINKRTAATIRHRRVQSFYVVTMNENGMIKTPYRSTSERQSGIFINIVNSQTNVPHLDCHLNETVFVHGVRT